jgi:hypothetical protein
MFYLTNKKEKGKKKEVEPLLILHVKRKTPDRIPIRCFSNAKTGFYF